MVVEPLNLQEIFVNYFSGSMNIFFWVSLIFFAWLGAKLRMVNIVFVMLMIAYILFMGKWFGKDIVFLTIIIVGLLIFWIWSKVGKE